MATRKAKITKRVVDSIKPGETVWDTEIAGFGIRKQVKATVYVLKKQIHGRQRWLTIGKHGEPFTADTAREKARVLLGQIADKQDPAKERDELKGRPTVSDLCDRYMADYAREHKKKSSAATDQMNIDNHIIPLLGKMFVADVTLADIDKFKRSVKSGKTARGLLPGHTLGAPVKGGKISANRCLALISKAFNLAIKWGLRTDNPVHHVEKYKERKVERFLSEAEFSALADAIRITEDQSSNPYPIAAIKLLIFTGARRNEILTLKWSNINYELGVITLDDSKTGSKPIYLNAPSKAVLDLLPRQLNNPYVICGAVKGSHLVNVRKPWLRIRELATIILWCNDEVINSYVLEHEKSKNKRPSVEKICSFAQEQKIELSTGLLDVRIHDLRHSFASVAAMGGMSLPMIGKLLGHAQSSTTDRYAHLADDPLKAANEVIGSRLDSLMGSKDPNIIALRGEN